MGLQAVHPLFQLCLLKRLIARPGGAVDLCPMISFLIMHIGSQDPMRATRPFQPSRVFWCLSGAFRRLLRGFGGFVQEPFSETRSGCR